MNQIDPFSDNLILDLALIEDGKDRKMMAMGDGWHTELVSASGASKTLMPLIEGKLGATFTSEKDYSLLFMMIHARNLENGKNSGGQPYPMSVPYEE